MVQNTRKDADWTVCDAASGTAAGVTVIAGAPDSSGARAAALDAGRPCWSATRRGTWLLWDGRRSRIDLADHAVTSALGLGHRRPPAAPCRRRACSTRFPNHRRWPRRSSRSRSPAKFPVPAPIGARRRISGAGRAFAAKLLRGVARRPAADLAGAGRDPAQHQLLRPGPAAAAGRRQGGQTAGVAAAGHQPLPRAADQPASTRPRSRHAARTGASRPGPARIR